MKTVMAMKSKLESVLEEERKRKVEVEMALDEDHRRKEDIKQRKRNLERGEISGKSATDCTNSTHTHVPPTLTPHYPPPLLSTPRS
jgi:hypothetical protein